MCWHERAGAEAMAYLLRIGAEAVETQQHHQSQETWIGWLAPSDSVLNSRLQDAPVMHADGLGAAAGLRADR